MRFAGTNYLNVQKLVAGGGGYKVDVLLCYDVGNVLTSHWLSRF